MEEKINKNISKKNISNGLLTDTNTKLENEVINLVKKNKYSEAIRKIDESLHLDENNIKAYLLKAGILQLMEKQDKSIKLYQYIIKKYPKNIDIYKETLIDAYINLIEIYDISYKMDKDDNKIIELCSDLETIDEQRTPYYLLAKAYRNLENYKLSMESYDKAIRQEKINLEAYSMILKSSEHPELKEMIEEKIDDSNSILYNSYCGKADVLVSIGKYKEAINNYKEAINLDIGTNREHENYYEYESIANAYSLLGDEEKASYYFKKAEESEKISDDLLDILRKKLGLR